MSLPRPHSGPQPPAPGTQVAIALTARPGDHAIVRVVAAPHRDLADPGRAAHLLEPFRRGRGAAPGRHSGLGLSIVTAITRAHGRTLAVVTRAEGGLVVRVRMTD